MPKTQGTLGARSQGRQGRSKVERIQDNVVDTQSARRPAKRGPAPAPPPHKKVAAPAQPVATDRVGNFFSAPARPVQINLQQSPRQVEDLDI